MERTRWEDFSRVIIAQMPSQTSGIFKCSGALPCKLYYSFAHGAGVFCPLLAIMEEVLGKIAQFVTYSRGNSVVCTLLCWLVRVYDTFSQTTIMVQRADIVVR